MQVRPVPMKGSRAIIGAQRPLHEQSPWSFPPQTRLRSSWAPSSPGGLRCGDTPLAALLSEGCVGTLLSLLCFRRGVWGHSSRCSAFGGVCGDTPLAALLSEGCVGTLLSLLCFRRGVWGHSSRCSVSEGCPHYYLRPTRLRLHAVNGVQHPLHRQSLRSLPAQPRFARGLTRSFFQAGRTILDPSTRTVHSPPELNQCSPIPAFRGCLSSYWIGSPAGIPGGRAASRF